jgi:glycosyltransferase involved in cell wall biosynthesis
MTSRSARIIFVAPFGFGQKTTVWARTLPLARHLAGRGHAVSLLIPPWDTPADAGKRYNDHGVEVVQVQVWGGLLPTLWRMVRVLTDFQPHIVHIVKPRAHAGIIQWWLWQNQRMLRGAPSVLRSAFSTPRSISPVILLDIDDWEQAWAPINRYTWPVARFLAWQEEWGIHHADGITAASRWLVERALQYSPRTPVLYLPNGIREWGVGNREWDVEDRNRSISQSPNLSVSPSLPPTPHSPPPTRILFYTRFVEVEPGWLAEFWRAVYERRQDLWLVVAGAPLHPGREQLYQHAVAQIGVAAARQVEWLGFVPGEQQGALYASATCAIFPATPVPLQQAKCSVRLASTLLHGVPVVASAVGEQSAYGADGAARLVEPAATPAQFAEAVLDLLAQPAEQQEMVAKARQHLCQQYPWPKLGDQLTTFYEQWL